MNIDRLAAWTSLGTVMIVVIAGLYLVGSPSRQRQLQLDEQRLTDLRRLTAALDSYWTDNKNLPTQLNELVDGRRLDQLPSDPSSDNPYDYELTKPGTYRLCAVFSLSAPDSKRIDFWYHDDGRYCFSFDVGTGPPG